MDSVEKYSKILIQLPPVESIKEKVSLLLDEFIEIDPKLYIETPWFEGFAIPWKSWWGFDKVFSITFQSRIKQVLRDFFGDEEMQIIEWIDKDRWEWLDVMKDSDEIFQAKYWKGNIDSVTAKSDYLKFSGGIERVVIISNLPELMKAEYYCFYPIFRKLARRGYWEKENFPPIRQRFYEIIGWN